jgi:methyltransferase (TIGR00027 family)
VPKNTDTPITDVMDTATWVASYRVDESQRPDALFHDPLASKLVGEAGAQISAKMANSEWVRWTVVIRTVIIDQYISELIAEGVDTVLNLGAGLDTRPYRMGLPANLKWIEVDYAKTIETKEKKLSAEVPKCQLQRHSLDLSDQGERFKFFSKINSESRKVLVLTEGVIPYLSEEDVAGLAQDLRAQKNFQYWITEYISPHVYRHFKHRKLMRQMRNAPFKFLPKDWYGHFAKEGWAPVTTRYVAEESEKLGRPIPLPAFATFIFRLVRKLKFATRLNRFSGFILFSPSQSRH